LTASGGFGSQGCELALCSVLAGRFGSVGFSVVAMWWPSVQRSCKRVPIRRALTGVRKAAGLCHTDNPTINALRLGRDRHPARRATPAPAAVGAQQRRSVRVVDQSAARGCYVGRQHLLDQERGAPPALRDQPSPGTDRPLGRPAPQARQGRVQDPRSEGFRDRPVAFAQVEHQRRLAHRHHPRRRSPLLFPTPCPERRDGQSDFEDVALPRPPCARPPRPRPAETTPETSRHLALGRHHHPRLPAHPRSAAPP
jgi:hypothetical protein